MKRPLINQLIFCISFHSHSFRFRSVDVCYDVVPSVPWLFRRRIAPSRSPQLEEHVPDYFVKPPTANCPRPYGLFLPRNAFSQNAEKSVFRIENLVFVAQGEWFTVFRYSGGDEPIIIKRANIFPLSFKYLLREKAMLGYLNHRNIARPISLDKLGLKKPAPGMVDGGFYPLACLGGKEEYWNDTYFMYEDGGASLKEWLHSSREVSLADVKSIALQLLEVLIYLQNMQVVHRDIRMESFVWSKQTLKLISLGKAKHMEPSTQEELDAVEQFEQEWAKPHESRAIPGFATTVRHAFISFLRN
jgi:serine/threonine protein kinase